MYNNIFTTLYTLILQLHFTNYRKIGFQAPGSSTFERIIDLHHFVFFFLIVILITVVWLLLNLINYYIIPFNNSLNNVTSHKDIVNYYCYGNCINISLIKNYGLYKYYHLICMLNDEMRVIFAKQALFMNTLMNNKTINKDAKKHVIALNEHMGLFFQFFIFFNILRKTLPDKTFTEHKGLEFAWTLVPCLILATISIPSFYVLYINEEILNPGLTVNIMGHQWYWSYDYSDLYPYWYNLVENNIDLDDFIIDSYMLPTSDITENDRRLLDTEEPLILPTKLHIRLLISGFDVLHSFAIPSMGLKIDAVPGRLNQLELFIKRADYFMDNAAKFVVLVTDLCL